MNQRFEKGVCIQSCAPIRALPGDRSEMVSQLLFGETYNVLDRKGNWILVRLDFDEYEGWLDQSQHRDLDANWHEQSLNSPAYFSLNRTNEAINEYGVKTLISFGSNLPELDQNTFSIDQKRFHLLHPNPVPTNCKPEVILKHAELLLNTPYMWGGRSVLGMDCSGFTQVVFKACGLKLYRDAHQQASQGSTIDFVEEAQAGDLAFFDNSEGAIVHTGIIMTNRQIIHASGSVRIDHIDHQGIFNSELNRYTHQLRLIRRILS
jgi:gamma-D-glutamyl-L-lysine dipeptidyl-peptidase